MEAFNACDGADRAKSDRLTPVRRLRAAYRGDGHRCASAYLRVATALGATAKVNPTWLSVNGKGAPGESGGSDSSLISTRSSS
jgi:hypothetical protein